MQTIEAREDWSRTIFVLTRMAWLRRGHKAVQALLSVRETEAVFLTCAKTFCHPFVQSHVFFLIEALGIQKLDGDAKERALFRLHKRKNQNPMFYCTKNEITYGNLKTKGFEWDDIEAEIVDSMETSATFLAEHLMPQLLQTSFGEASLCVFLQLTLSIRRHCARQRGS